MSAKEPSLMTLAFRLGLIAALAAFILAAVDFMTREPRLSAQQAVVEKTMKAVLPPYDNIGDAIAVTVENNKTDITLLSKMIPSETAQVYIFRPVFIGTDSLIGYAVESTSNKGYGGKITVMFGLDPDGVVGIVNVISHKETPGLGTAETDRKKQKTIFTLFDPDDGSRPPNTYLDQFTGRKKENTGWKVEKDGGDVKYKTGATVTMRAITEAVSDAVSVYMKDSNSIAIDLLSNFKEVK